MKTNTERRAVINLGLDKFLKRTVKWVWSELPFTTCLTISKLIDQSKIRITFSNYMVDPETGLTSYNISGEVWKNGIAVRTHNWGMIEKGCGDDSPSFILSKIGFLIRFSGLGISWYKLKNNFDVLE